MDKPLNINGYHSCDTCNKEYSSYKSLWNHNKKYHNEKTQLCQVLSSDVKSVSSNCQVFSNKIICDGCNKVFNTRQAKSLHKKKCNINLCDDKDIKLKEQDKEILKLKLELQKYQKEIKLKDQIINENTTYKKNTDINNHLIMDKTNTIKKLKNKNDTSTEITHTNDQLPSLKLNNVNIVSRQTDKYINATLLCQAGNKKFSHWFSLDTTKQLIKILESNAGIPALDLVQVNKGGNHYGSWIHPDLAIQLAQWISPKFALQVSQWIRTLFTNGTVSFDIKLLEEITTKDKKIKLLQDICVKKHKRIDYPEKNVIYVITTEDNKNKRIYIIGKSKSLKNRLSTYNKTAEHEVIYYKECGSESNMNIIEYIVLTKLEKYKERANRDRFILPIDEDISLFTNVIDLSIQFIKN